MTTRRDLLRAGLAGAGLIGLRAMATGLPISFLLNPKVARSEEACTAMRNAQFLILSMSASGDALNCNVPGTYDLPAAFPVGSVNHPMTPEMAQTALKLSGKSYSAAAPWATLPQNVLDRTVFFHHRTQTANHGEMGKVLQLFAELRRGQWLVSYFAKNLYECFGTVQPQPVTLGAESLSYEGRYLPRLTPTGLKAILTGPSGLQKTMQRLRDDSLNKMNALLKEKRNETRAERAFLDQMVTSQQQLRTLIDQVAADLQMITGDDATNQINAAALLIKMNVTPAVTIHLPFSGDNHVDVGWKNESAQTVASVANINLLMNKLKAYGLQDKVTFCALNVFGREVGGLEGRGHNASHNVAVMIGKGLKGGVIGGLAPGGKCTDIDSVSGAAAMGGDVAASASLPAVAKTLGVALGLSEAQVNDQITSGKVVRGALA